MRMRGQIYDSSCNYHYYDLLLGSYMVVESSYIPIHLAPAQSKLNMTSLIEES